MRPNFARTELKITAGLPGQFPKDLLPQLALCGRSNVGKSSLINTVIGRKSYARVSGTPGKTITLNFYLVDRAFYLVDLPGYGFARRDGEAKRRFSDLTQRYFIHSGARVSAAAQLVDLKVGLTEDDRLMLGFLSAQKIPFFVVATKADKPNKTEREKQLAALLDAPELADAIGVLPFSSQNGEGKEGFWQLAAESLGL